MKTEKTAHVRADNREPLDSFRAAVMDEMSSRPPNLSPEKSPLKMPLSTRKGVGPAFQPKPCEGKGLTPSKKKSISPTSGLHNPQLMKRSISPLNFSKSVKLPPKTVLKNYSKLQKNHKIKIKLCWTSNE